MKRELKKSVKDYLDQRAQTDELFAKAYSKPHKNIDECVDYILSQAKEMRQYAIKDEVVYGWAVHYYDEDALKVDKFPDNSAKVIKANAELTEEEKQKAYEQAMQEYKAQCLAEIKAKEEAKAKKEKEKRAALIAKRKEQENMTLSLFDF